MNKNNFERMKEELVYKLNRALRKKKLENILNTNKEFLYEDKKDEILIEILKMRKFNIIPYYIKIKKEKKIKLSIEPLIKSFKNKKFKMKENKKFLKMLIEETDTNKKDLNENSPLIHAIKLNHPENIIQLLIKKEKDINHKNKFKESILMHELKHKHPENIIKLLINKKTDINKTDEKGNSPLIYALKKKFRKYNKIINE